jgi:hypothetical protein
VLKRLLTVAVVGTVVKVVMAKLKGRSDEADLWAEATDSVAANR